MCKHCTYCNSILDEFAYYVHITENWYCSRECTYSDLDVLLFEGKAEKETCYICDEKLDSEIYETYKSDSEYFCRTECVDQYWGIHFRSIPPKE